MNLVWAILLSVFLVMGLFVGCGQIQKVEENDSGKIKVIATDFAPYDFTKRVAGTYADVSMLLAPGQEAHSFEPTPKDIIAIKNCDVFVYTGGESESWVNDLLDDLESKVRVVRLMDCVELYEEETVEGMQEESGHDHGHDSEEEDEHEHSHLHEKEHEHSEEEEHEEEDEHTHEEEEAEYDEHIWTSPINAMKITTAIAKTLEQADEKHAAGYQKNKTEYNKELKQLHRAFLDVVAHSKRKLLVFGDRFPLRYFVEEYGLSYYAAFPGCASDTEPSAKTVAFLIDKVKEEKIPVIFHVEYSNENMCNTICEDTGAKKRQFNACHSISKEEFQRGVGYLDLMWENVAVLKEALQ